MINISQYLTAALLLIAKSKVQPGPFPEECDAEQRIRQTLDKGINFLTSMGMKIPLHFRYTDVLKLYEPYASAFSCTTKLDMIPCGSDYFGSSHENQQKREGDREKRSRPRPKEGDEKLSGINLKFVESLLLTFETRAKDFVRRVSELCLIFGIELDAWEEDLEFNKYFLLEFYFQTIPQLKYSTNLAYCKFWNVELPEYVPLQLFGNDLWPKRLAVELKRLSGASNRRRFSAQVKINTLFMGFKKGLLPSGPEVVQKSLDTNATKLSKVTKVPDFICDDIAKKIRELIRFQTGKPILNFDEAETHNQSTKSTLSSTYSDGGNIGFAKNELYGKNGFWNSGSRKPQRGCEYFKVPDLYSEFVGYVRPVTCFVDEGWKPVYSTCPVFTKDLLEIFPHKPINYGDQVEPLINEVSPSFILEPMKVRTITRPSTGLHVRMHKVQKLLWKFLYKHDSSFFDLIGEPLTRSHLIPLLNDLQTGDQFVSGDYSAATDNLNNDISHAIICELLSGSKDPVLNYNIVQTLTKSRINQTLSHFPTYGNAFDKFTYRRHDPFVQSNGQLMGHVISFVVLCLANVCCYWQAVESFVGRSVGLAELKAKFPVRVNGDDILFKTRGDLIEHWYTRLATYGFTPSVGKNFVTDKFMQVNSKLFRVDTSFNNWKSCKLNLLNLVEIPYVNFGLLTNRNKQDCSKDTSVQRISSVDLKHGDIEEESLLGRLKTYPKIYESVLELKTDAYGKEYSALPKKIAEVTRSLVKKHFLPVLKSFGLGSVFKNFDHPMFRKSYGEYIVRNNKIYSPEHSDMLNCFNELSTKLDRGYLGFEFEQSRGLRKFCFANELFFCTPRVERSTQEFSKVSMDVTSGRELPLGGTPILRNDDSRPICEYETNSEDERAYAGKWRFAVTSIIPFGGTIDFIF